MRCSSVLGLTGLVGTAAFAGACSDAPGLTRPGELSCGELDPIFLADGGVGRDGIPALTDPAFVENGDGLATAYLNDQDRVVGVFLDGEWLAIPHNVMYYHEIVNLSRGSQRIAVSYCPLTGSALAFDRAQVGGAEFGVSGLLYNANLIMYDRNTPDESLWPQMAGSAGCGSKEGLALTSHPVVEMTWQGWQREHPDGKVIGIDSHDAESYTVNPYGDGYEATSNGSSFGFPIRRIDQRRRPKERVLGLPGNGIDPPRAFPFLAMAVAGDAWVGELEYGGEAAAVFWDLDRSAAVAVRPVVEGERLTFRVENGEIFDNETGSHWTVTGQSSLGAHQGKQLELIPEAYVAFWMAWAAFHPGTDLAIE